MSISKVGRARYTADGGQKKAAGLAARHGAVTVRADVVGDPRAASRPPTRHALAQSLRRPPRATVRAWLSDRDHDPLQKGENRTRLSGSTDAQPYVLSPSFLDTEDIHRYSSKFQTPPDFVVKCQDLDIVGVILQLV
jgi:hypothetical protein